MGHFFLSYPMATCACSTPRDSQETSDTKFITARKIQVSSLKPH